MDAVNLATVIVAIIAAAGAWASQRAAAKAASNNTLVGGRVDMEKEAYNRARVFDTETINRQNKEIDDLRIDHNACLIKIRSQEEEIRVLRTRIARLEQDLPHNIEEKINERLKHNTGDTAV